MRAQHISKMTRGIRGISLIEVTVIIVAIGIMAALAMRSMTALMGDAKQSQTEQEMEMLAHAITGDPSIMSVAGGIRSDFGYVGDVGALPGNLQALVTDPGLGTWNGPYIETGFNEESNNWQKDAWGTNYGYSGVTITSTGSGSTITRKFADSTADLLLNQVAGLVKDSDDNPPTSEDTADVNVEITMPDGAGSTTTKTYHPDTTGEFTLDSIPIGRHLLEVIHTIETDTLTRYVTVAPRNNTNDVIRFNFDTTYFDTSGAPESEELTLVADSDTAYGDASGDCYHIKFWFENKTANPIQVSSVSLSYSTSAYYDKLDYAADEAYEFDATSSRNESGDVVTLSPPRTIIVGSSEVLALEGFLNTQAGTGEDVDMSTTTFTVTFSDGSSFDVTMSYCE